MDEFIRDFTPWIALTGLLLGLFNFIIRAIEFFSSQQKKRKKLKVILKRDLSIDEKNLLPEEIQDMEDAGIPQSNIPSIWSFKYKGEIFIKNIGDADIHVDSIKLILKHPNVRFEINPNTQEGTILLTKGKPHTTFFFFEPENKDLQKFMEAKSMVEVVASR